MRKELNSALQVHPCIKALSILSKELLERGTKNCLLQLSMNIDEMMSFSSFNTYSEYFLMDK